jgi:hypothetical protein
MPRPTRHNGRPGTPVIPENWQADHAAVIGKTFPDTITIGPPGTGAAFNETRGQTETTTAALVYNGPARITAVSFAPQPVAQAEEQIPVRTYEIALPWATAGIKTSHIVTVTASTDGQLDGQVLQLSQVERDSHRFSRILLATLDH